MKLLVDFNVDFDTSSFNISDIQKLESKINLLHEKYEKQLNLIFSEPDYEGFGWYKYSKTASVFENLTEVIDELEEELSMQTGYLKENPLSYRADKYKTNIKTL